MKTDERFSLIFQSEADEIIARARLAKKLTEQLRRLTSECVGLAVSERHDHARAEDLESAGLNGEGRLARDRARRIRHERALKLYEMSRAISAVMEVAACYLVVDETTADTGLDEEQRRRVARASGVDLPW